MIELERVPFHCFECDAFFYPEEFASRDEALMTYTKHRGVCGR